MVVSKIFLPSSYSCVEGCSDPKTSSRDDVMDWVATRLNRNDEIDQLCQIVEQKLLKIDPLFIKKKRTESRNPLYQLALTIYYSFMRIWVGKEKTEKWIALYCYLDTRRLNEKTLTAEKSAAVHSSSLTSGPIEIRAIEHQSEQALEIHSDYESDGEVQEEPDEEGDVFHDCASEDHPQNESGSLAQVSPEQSSEIDTDTEGSEIDFFDPETEEKASDLEESPPMSPISTPPVSKELTPKEKLKRCFKEVLGEGGSLFVEHLLPEMDQVEIDESSFTLRLPCAYNGKINTKEEGVVTDVNLSYISLWIDSKVMGSIDLINQKISFQGGLIGYYTKIPGYLISLQKGEDNSLVLTGSFMKLQKELPVGMDDLLGITNGLQVSWEKYTSWFW